jgi:hypothetical protein
LSFIPSERTIETLSNHALLEILNSGWHAAPYAWMFVPSQWHEQFLGYDAGLFGHKRLFIQYKIRNGSGTFTFDFRQLWLLCRLNPRHGNPYVFFSGNTISGYGLLSASHMPPAVDRYNAFNSTFYLDAWLLLERLVDLFSLGAVALPNVLPPLAPLHCDGDITMKVVAGGLAVTLKEGTKLEDSLEDLCLQLGYAGPFVTLPATLMPVPVAGWGRTFVEEVAACNFGRPLGLPLDFQNIQQLMPLLGHCCVLTLPMI